MSDQDERTLIPEQPNKNDGATEKGQEMSLTLTVREELRVDKKHYYSTKGFFSCSSPDLFLPFHIRRCSPSKLVSMQVLQGYWQE